MIFNDEYLGPIEYDGEIIFQDESEGPIQLLEQALSLSGLEADAFAISLIGNAIEITSPLIEGDIDRTYSALQDAIVGKIPVTWGPLGPLSEPVLDGEGRLKVKLSLPFPIFETLINRLRIGSNSDTDAQGF